MYFFTKQERFPIFSKLNFETSDAAANAERSSEQRAQLSWREFRRVGLPGFFRSTSDFQRSSERTGGAEIADSAEAGNAKDSQTK